MTTNLNENGKRRWVRETEAARYLGLSKALLAKDRCRNHLGIPFIRLGRAILYDLKALESWMESKSIVGQDR
jgi:hypothetical protein